MDWFVGFLVPRIIHIDPFQSLSCIREIICLICGPQIEVRSSIAPQRVYLF
jgi:hypothetical protein